MKKLVLSMAILMPSITLIGAPNQETTPAFVQSNKAISQADSGKIKVLIVHDKAQVQLNIDGKYRIYDPHAKKHVSTRLLGKNQVIQSVHDGLKWGEEFPGLHQLKFVPGDSDTRIFIDGIAYKGNLYIYDIGGTLSVVNELPIDDYLYSTLAFKLSKPMAGEVLAALVIAARTNAQYQIQNPRSPFWDTNATGESYPGLIKENSHPPLEKALKNTKDMVLSLTGKFDNTIKTFPIEWDNFATHPNTKLKPVKSLITLNEADDLTKNGEHADVILKKAFPQASLHIISNE